MVDLALEPLEETNQNLGRTAIGKILGRSVPNSRLKAPQHTHEEKRM